ncbi:MAG: hypothetical protein F6K41_34605, partial [Symploca sp. SIO3E6]|nr:hypothetical protein [Caldora sp. SIO3E6]
GIGGYSVGGRGSGDGGDGGNGGGIFANTGALTLTNSTVSGNTATGGDGGNGGNGVYGGGDGGNGGNGGGIFANTGALTLTNSTVSGNTATGGIGGIGGNGGNDGDGGNGGGIYINDTQNNTITNSIIANNTSDTGPDISADLSSSNIQFSLIEDTAGITAGAPTNGVNGNIVGVDPQLLPLGDYGGPTQTHALSPNSPALNAGDNDQLMGLTTDQRGKARISGTTVDIGAFELQLLLTIAGGNNQSTTVNTAFADKLQIQVIDEFNNSVSLPGVTVELAALGTTANAELGDTTLTTDASGADSTTATANKISGTYQVAATADGITGVNFELTNNPGAANSLTILAGDNQSTTVNTAFANNLQVKVIDEFGNVVPGVTVTLTPIGTGAGIRLDNVSFITNNEGVATTRVTANTIAGNYRLEAGVAGVPNFTGGNFSLTNLSLPIVVPGDSTLVIDTSDFTPVVVPGDSTPNNSPDLIPIPDFTPIWQSVIEELPQSGLEESACQTTPAIAINSTEEEGEITLDKEIEAAIQRNQDCQPALIGN